jgi:hypothetical protein
MQVVTSTEKKQPHRWKKGQSGNPRGRKVGSRNKLRDEFFIHLSNAWTKYGEAALMTCAMTTPTEFCRMVAHLMPRDVEIAVTQSIKLERMPTSELRAILARYRHDHGNALEASRAENGVFQVGKIVRSDTGQTSPPADGKADQGKPR